MKKNKYLLTENPGSICIHDREFNSICDFWKDSENQKELSKLSQIAADAFNTANKCGLLPSQLLEQNKRLLQVLKDITIYCRHNMTNQLEPLISQANEIINQIEQ